MHSHTPAMKPKRIFTLATNNDSDLWRFPMKLMTSASALMAFFYAGSALAQTKPPGIPEPGVWALMGIGVAAFAARHFMKKR